MTVAVAVVAVVAVVTLTGGQGTRAGASAALPSRAIGLRILPSVSLSASAPAARKAAQSLPKAAWVISFDVWLATRSRLSVTLGAPADRIVLSRGTGPAPTLQARGRTYILGPRDGWPSAAWRHVEVSSGRDAHLTVDGHAFPVAAAQGGRLSLQAAQGSVQVRALVVSAVADRASLLLHRLVELHARVPAGTFPIGADRRNRLHFDSLWTSGFWPGALWQAAALAPEGQMFSNWAITATVAHFGLERSPTHDVGFMYGESSVAAWRSLCRDLPAPAAVCGALKRSALAAADELMALASTNPGAGTIPTDATSPLARTIVDSMMNISILPWATRVTHNPAYAAVAAHQAQVIAALLVRPDGSTSQAVQFDRSSGRIAAIGTDQGLSDTSTWSRGQGWAIYGFAQAAADLHDRSLLAVAQRLAGYVAHHLPPGGVPPWDYAAPAGAPVDVSAGVITAAGLLHLLAACRELPDTCPNPGQWGTLARVMLAAALRKAGDRPPIGFLGSQVLDARRPTCCNGGELMFGLTYALEALALERSLHA